MSGLTFALPTTRVTSVLSYLIEDDAKYTKKIPEVAGVHCEVDAVYKPAFALVRANYQWQLQQKNAGKQTEMEDEILSKHIVTLNGQSVTREQVKRIRPTLRSTLLDLILGYVGCDDEDEVNEG